MLRVNMVLAIFTYQHCPFLYIPNTAPFTLCMLGNFLLSSAVFFIKLTFSDSGIALHCQTVWFQLRDEFFQSEKVVTSRDRV